MKKFLFFCSSAILLSNLCLAQTYSKLTQSDTIAVQSKVFGSLRKVIITKSVDIQNESGDNNCIIYMDADSKNINGLLLQSADNLTLYKEMPKSFLVGIIQQDRNNELLEKEKLLSFIKADLIPLLEKSYKISKKITIAGHSFGAYFATYAFLKENGIFNSCIAISPAYWPNKEDILSLMSEKIKANTVSGNFYLAVGDKRWDEISLKDYVFKAKTILTGYKEIRLGFNELKGFSHNATPTVGFGLGLGSIYDEWEWANILEEQEKRLKDFPDFWGHLEVKGDALYHLNRLRETKIVYQEAIKNIAKDEGLSRVDKNKVTKRINGKIRNLKQ